MMDAIVQFVRNALCCMKDLNIYGDTFLYKEEYTNEWISTYSNGKVELIEPLNKTTPLEVLISITQLYACLSVTYSGFSLLWVSVGKMKHTVRLLELRMPSDEEKRAGKRNKKFTDADRIVNESLLKETKAAMKGSFVGFLVAPIGIAFFWLFANSWHVTETPWIGGLVALIDALSVMEVCLFPLLVYMILDGRDIFKQYNQIQDTLDAIESDELKSAKSISVQLYENMTDWQPFWEAGLSPLGSVPTGTEETKEIEDEVKAVQSILDRWFPVSSSDDDDDGEVRRTRSKAKVVDDKKEKGEKIRKQALKKASVNMKQRISELYIKGYREFIYFVLNFVAFYGYLMAIIAFYYPDDDHQPSWVTQMKFGYGNAVADWTGNFAGDLMWTIEPIFILGSPMVMSFSKPSIEDDDDSDDEDEGDNKKSLKAKEE